ncbi:MAG: aryl-sulfate sulfotransferase [Acidobacteriota bacterium]
MVALSRFLPAMDVTLVAKAPGPVMVGDLVRFKGQIADSSGSLWYRFRVREGAGEFRTIRDYGPLPSLEWTTFEFEGDYEMELSVRDRKTGETREARTTVHFAPRATDQPTVTPTAHPLVVLYSAPRCESGNLRVDYVAANSGVLSSVSKPCQARRTVNFLLGALRPETTYSATLVTEHPGFQTSVAPVTFTTGSAPANVPATTTVLAAPVSSQGILLQANLFSRSTATDLSGNLLWYGPSDLTYLTRPEPGGRFFGVILAGIDPARDVVREFDLTGMTVSETNVARMNEQLSALGRRTISGFHHEACRLPDGNVLVLASVEQILTDVQGPGPVDVIGDMVLVLDRDLQVVWTWDTFDHLDPARAAVLGETCTSGGCPPHYLSPTANDWTHGNSVQRTPDGNLLFSMRHQDWVIKIDYRDGAGDGDVLWKLGRGGDFALDPPDDHAWFSHQHDARYDPQDPTAITMFDNGNTRAASVLGEVSRGLSIRVDESAKTARLVLDAHLPYFSLALGSAQRLEDGGYHFLAGWVVDPAAPTSPPSAYSFQTDAAGNIVFSIQTRTMIYRSFRMSNLDRP